MKLLPFHSVLFAISIFISCCNRYVDKVTPNKKIPIYQGSLTYYKDSNILFYKNRVGEIRGLGTKGKAHKPYYIKLPKQLIWWQVGADDFIFDYKHKQAIAFYMDLFDDVKIKDTAYIPTQKDIENFPPHRSIDDSKYTIRNIPMLRNRRHYIIYKGDAIILLYNILPSNYERFLQAANSFKFL